MYDDITHKNLPWMSILVSATLAIAHIASGTRVLAEPATLPARMQPVALDSGAVGNPSNVPQSVFQQVIDLGAGVPWARVLFDEAATVLPPGSYIRVTSLLDGETQILDADEFENWSYGTAFFNGSQIEVELVAGANTAGNKLAIAEAFSGEPVAAAAGGGVAAVDQDTDPDPILAICGGTDDRGPENHAAVGRLLIGRPVPQQSAATCSGGARDTLQCTYACPGGDCNNANLCNGGTRNGQACDCPGGNCTYVNRICIGGNNDGGQCKVDADCPAGVCRTPGNKYCLAGPSAGLACVEPCAAGNCVGICDGGTQDGFTCTGNAQCPGGTCRSGRCSDGANIAGGCDSNANCPAGGAPPRPAGVCEGVCLGGGLVKCTVPCPQSYCDPTPSPALRFGVGTAWIEDSNLGSDKIHLTAGHNFLAQGVEAINQGSPAPLAAVLQFNVPPSNANCSVNHPPVASQFPVLPNTVIARATWVGPGTLAGTDWAVFKCGRNNEGQTTFEKQRSAFTLVPRPLAVFALVRHIGYGADGTDGNAAPGGNLSCTCNPAAAVPSGTRHTVQQNAFGHFISPLAGDLPDRLRHEIDTCAGDSGAPLVFPWNELKAYGIHTNGGCGAICVGGTTPGAPCNVDGNCGGAGTCSDISGNNGGIAVTHLGIRNAIATLKEKKLLPLPFIDAEWNVSFPNPSPRHRGRAFGRASTNDEEKTNLSDEVGVGKAVAWADPLCLESESSHASVRFTRQFVLPPGSTYRLWLRARLEGVLNVRNPARDQALVSSCAKIRRLDANLQPIEPPALSIGCASPNPPWTSGASAAGSTPISTGWGDTGSVAVPVGTYEIFGELSVVAVTTQGRLVGTDATSYFFSGGNEQNSFAINGKYFADPIPPGAAAGACCPGDGMCFVATQQDCEIAGGDYAGDYIECGGDADENGIVDTCEERMLSGACCHLTGECTIDTEADCESAGALYNGDYTQCSGDTNEDGVDDACQGHFLAGACCLENGSCVVGTPDECMLVAGLYLGDDSICQGDEAGNGIDDACEPPILGACCDHNPFGGCEDDVLEANCACDQLEWFENRACAEVECLLNPIPTVSEWGLVVMALLLLTGAKIYFGRRRTEAIVS